MKTAFQSTGLSPGLFHVVYYTEYCAVQLSEAVLSLFLYHEVYNYSNAFGAGFILMIDRRFIIK